MNFWENSVLVPSLMAWLLAQIIKVLIHLIKYKRLDFRRFVGSGGMPSSHSSLVTALATAVVLKEGFESVEFGICTVLALIVMYDAAGVRRAAGQQARILNKIVANWEKSDFSETDKHLKELLGHTPKEVFAGAVLGIAISVIWYFV